MEKITWTTRDATKAEKQGWNLFSDGVRPFQLQRVDDLKVFTDDREAWEYVYVRASKGKRLALKALACIAMTSPEELLFIKDWVERNIV